MATKATLNSLAFKKKEEKVSADAKIIARAGIGIVELIESGNLDHPDMRSLLEKYTTPMLKEGADIIVLGCTHYSYLFPILEKIIPSTTKIIDTRKSVTQKVKDILYQQKNVSDRENKGKTTFFATGVIYLLNIF